MRGGMPPPPPLGGLLGGIAGLKKPGGLPLVPKKVVPKEKRRKLHWVTIPKERVINAEDRCVHSS
jgi:hypothetical protein